MTFLFCLTALSTKKTKSMTGVSRWYGKAGNKWLTFGLISSAEMNWTDNTSVFKVNE